MQIRLTPKKAEDTPYGLRHGRGTGYLARHLLPLLLILLCAYGSLVAENYWPHLDALVDLTVAAFVVWALHSIRMIFVFWRPWRVIIWNMLVVAWDLVLASAVLGMAVHSFLLLASMKQ